jgi:hypothetical protein
MPTAMVPASRVSATRANPILRKNPMSGCALDGRAKAKVFLLQIRIASLLFTLIE